MADSISDARNTARSVTNAADSFAGFSDQGVVPQKSENEHRQPSVEKDAALSTCQTRLEPDGSKAGLLDNISERSSPVSSEKMTADQRQRRLEKIEQLEKLEERFNELLPALTLVFTEDETEIVQMFIDADEFGLTLETVLGIVSEQSKIISQEAFSAIIEIAAMMRMDIDEIKTALTGCVCDDKT